MYLIHALADLLQRLNDAEDESAALAEACRWIERQPGVRHACILDEASLVVAGEGRSAAAITMDERRDVAAQEMPLVRSRPDGVMVAAPVRYAGARIGAVVIAGTSEEGQSLSELAQGVAAATAPALRTRLDELALRASCHTRMPEILGVSPAVAALREAIPRAALSSFPVLVEGESGSGKELVARAIHRLSPRRDRRFAALNCAALTDELAEAELFGHARGAFTGAIASRAGLFEEAHLGTLFLDEVSELSARTQARLLRAIQEREVRRLGENSPRAVNVRLVSATNRRLRHLVDQGLFREDLLFRLAVIRISVPPLRERAEDVPILAVACWRRVAADVPTLARLGPDALARLARHSWPGNVRELQNVMAALAVGAPARGRITARHVDHVLAASGQIRMVPARSLEVARAECERHTVAAALARHSGRRAAAARELGLTRQGLSKALRRLQLDDARSPRAGVA